MIPRVGAARSTSSSSAAGEYPLPPEVTESAIWRLAWISICFSITFAGVYLTGRLLRLGWIDPAAAPDSYSWSLGLGALSGLLMGALVFYRKIQNADSTLTLDFGLVYEVLGGFLIALAEHAIPRAPGEIIRGQSSLALWIAFFVLAVPTTFNKTLLAALATACMGPLAHAIHVLLGNVPNPPAAMWLLHHAPVFPLAVGAALLTRFIYRLGAQVSRAREMGSYHLVELIGRGGMGEVWRAQHRLLARQAAIKLIRAEPLLTGTPERIDDLARRFEREARAIASLHSPYTVALYDYGVSPEGEFYYVMELLDGLDLENFVKAFGPVPAPRVIYILRQVCYSLAEAHAKGIIHRDVKPRNILVCRLGGCFDFVKVLDFGLAKLREEGDEPQITREGSAPGTPAYMAPEIALGKAGAGPASDIYALGCVTYWLLTGRLVFAAPNATSMLMAHIHQPADLPSQATDNEISAELDRVVLACLAKQPEARPANARHLASMLASCPEAGVWTPDHAEQWWGLHAPRTGPAT